MAARIVAAGRVLTPDDVADRLAAIGETYSTDGDPQTVVADGFGCKVTVHHGALVVADGVGEHRRERRYSKVMAPERVLVTGDGTVSVEALSWCHANGTAVVVLRPGGGPVLASSPPGRDDARVRRQQALAGVDGSPVGLAVVRFLLGEKLRGQARNLAAMLRDETTASTLFDLADGIEATETVDEARQLEASGAAAYFATWAGHPAAAARFVARDRPRVPGHWQTFDSRRSALGGRANTNRQAERPVNALLNLTYKLAEVEAAHACRRVGLDPGLGILHLDAAGRDSLALDVIEPLRPEVDRFVLTLLAERTFHKRTFVERADGHVRVAAPLSHELAATMPTWRRAVAPVVERVVHLFTDAVSGKVTKTTPLTGAKGRAASAEVRRRKAVEARVAAEAVNTAHRLAQPVRRRQAPAPQQAAVAFARCVTCGGQLARSRHVRCEQCWERQGGAQSRDARRRRGRSIAAARTELDAWRAAHPHANADPAAFAPVRAALADVTLSRIMAATGCSKATASGWRAGRHVPPLARWAALADLAGVGVPVEIVL